MRVLMMLRMTIYKQRRYMRKVKTRPVEGDIRTRIIERDKESMILVEVRS